MYENYENTTTGLLNIPIYQVYILQTCVEFAYQLAGSVQLL